MLGCVESQVNKANVLLRAQLDNGKEPQLNRPLLLLGGKINDIALVYENDNISWKILSKQFKAFADELFSSNYCIDPTD